MNNTTYTYNERPVWSETLTQINSYSEPTLSIDQKHIVDNKFIFNKKNIIHKNEINYNLYQ